MVSQISLLGVTLHAYGFILGIALLVGLHIFQRLLEKKFTSLSEKQLYYSLSTVLVSAVVGARAWHVITDYWLYRNDPMAILFIWNGGLSIFGALFGGAVAVVYAHKKWLSDLPLLALFDAAAISIPFGQSIGRWANFVNQEVYGLPTNLPWAISIDPTHRLNGYAQYERFHPLFLYESIAMAVFGFWLWRQQKKRKIGSGYYITVYLLFYSLLRFFLDFLRIGLPKVLSVLSFNQVILLVVLCIAVAVLYRSKKRLVL